MVRIPHHCLRVLTNQNNHVICLIENCRLVIRPTNKETGGRGNVTLNLKHIRDRRWQQPRVRVFDLNAIGMSGIDAGLIASMPIKVDADGRWDVVPGVELDEFSREKVDATLQELRDEREAVADLL